MVIQCPECQTRFKLADEKLKPAGVKVRCSRCRHIFTVTPPEPAAEEGIDFGEFNMEPVPEERPAAPPEAPASAGPAPAAGGEAFDFGDETEAPAPSAEPAFEEEEGFGGGDFDFGDETEAVAPSTEPAFGEEEGFGGEDFDFGDAAEAPAPAAEPALGEEEGFGGGDFDFGEEAETAAPTAEPAPAVEEGFGADDFDFGEEEAAAPAEFSFGEEEEPGTDDFGFGEEETGDLPEEFSFDEEPAADESWGEEPDGPPEDFDFGEEAKGVDVDEEFDLSGMTFGEEAPRAPQPSAEGEFGGFALDTEPEVAMPATGAERPAPPTAPAAPQVRAVPGKRKAPIRRLMVFVLLLLLALCGAAGYFLWQRGEIDFAKLVEQLTGQTAPAPVSGQIRLTDLTSAFATNREAGQLFVIRGNAVNDYPEARSAIAVKGIVYNPQGKQLLQQTVFCGNPLDEAALRDLPFAKIQEHMNNQFGDTLSNLNVASGKAIPFTVVFRNLPPDLAEFTVEVADSKAGSKQ